MFASNQILDVLVTEDQLKPFLDFAIGMSDDIQMFIRDDGRVSLAFSEPAKGVYAIGRGSMPNPSWCKPQAAGRGWTDYQFDYDTDILSKIIWQWVRKQDYPDAPDTDGSVEKCIRCMSVPTALQNGVLPPYHEICNSWSPWEASIVFVPEWAAYDK